MRRAKPAPHAGCQATRALGRRLHARRAWEHDRIPPRRRRVGSLRVPWGHSLEVGQSVCLQDPYLPVGDPRRQSQGRGLRGRRWHARTPQEHSRAAPSQGATHPAQSRRARSRACPLRQTSLQSSSGPSQTPAAQPRRCRRCQRRWTPCLCQRPRPRASSSAPALHPQPPAHGRRGPCSVPLGPSCLLTLPASYPLDQAGRHLPMQGLSARPPRLQAITPAPVQGLVQDPMPPSAARALTLTPAPVQGQVRAPMPPSAAQALAPRRRDGRAPLRWGGA